VIFLNFLNFKFKSSLHTSLPSSSPLYYISHDRGFRKWLEIHCGHGFGLLTMTMVNPTSVFLKTLGHVCQTFLGVINLNTKKEIATMTTTLQFVYFDSTKVVN
jgi:hypothetical protein